MFEYVANSDTPLLYYDIGGHRKYVMFTSADRPYFGWKNPNQKIGKNVGFFYHGGSCQIYY